MLGVHRKGFLAVIYRPYDRVSSTRELLIMSAQIKLDCGELGIEAETRGGVATIRLVEEFDDIVTAWGLHDPVRLVSPRRRLMLELDSPLKDLVWRTSLRNGESGG